MKIEICFGTKFFEKPPHGKVTPSIQNIHISQHPYSEKVCQWKDHYVCNGFSFII